MKSPERIDLDVKQVDALLQRTKELLPPDDYELIKAMIALLKYGTGMPFNRIEELQHSLSIPLPASTQFEIADQVAGEIDPVYQELIRQGAQGDVIHNDDTTMKILSLIKENKEDDPERKFASRP